MTNPPTRNDEDREINHHGRPVEVAAADPAESNVEVFFKINPIQKHLYLKVPADKDLVAVNEQVQLKALKMFYDR